MRNRAKSGYAYIPTEMVAVERDKNDRVDR